MLDLGTTFVASLARDPDALAVVDGALRLTYAQWYQRISALVAAFDQLDLRSGDHLVTVLTNRWEAATLHWACQFAGIIITPLNWRASADDLDFCLNDADAKAVVYEDVAAPSMLASKEAQSRVRIAVDARQPGEISFEQLVGADRDDAQPHADASAWSVMLYTS